MAIAYTDIARQITQILDADADAFDVDAITETIIDRYGLVDVDTVSTAEFWDIVAVCEYAAPEHDFRAELSEAMAGAGIAEAAQWTDGTVTVTVTGMSRVSLDWPQAWAVVTITTPAGVETLQPGSWEELWARVEEARTTFADEADRALSRIAGAHATLTRAEAATQRARSARDEMIRAAAGEGVTAYRIAKVLGVAESTVGRIIARR